MRAKSTIDNVQQNQDQYTSVAREECETFDRLQTIKNLLTAAHGYAMSVPWWCVQHNPAWPVFCTLGWVMHSIQLIQMSPMSWIAVKCMTYKQMLSTLQKLWVMLPLQEGLLLCVWHTNKCCQWILHWHVCDIQTTVNTAIIRSATATAGRITTLCFSSCQNCHLFQTDSLWWRNVRMTQTSGFMWLSSPDCQVLLLQHTRLMQHHGKLPSYLLWQRMQQV